MEETQAAQQVMEITSSRIPIITGLLQSAATIQRRELLVLFTAHCLYLTVTRERKSCEGDGGYEGEERE